MIKLAQSRFTDILPEQLSEQVEVKAVAYAMGRQIEKLCACAERIQVYSKLSAVTEQILDLLAIELRTPAYDENYSIKVKRALIEGTMLYYQQMGTPAAVNKLIETIFGNGHIVEWWEYGGEPHHFKVYTTNPTITKNDVEEFGRVLKSVKRLSSWLDDLILELATPAMELYVGHWLHTGDVIILKRAMM